MSQRSEKLRRQVDILKERMDVMDSRVYEIERYNAAWDESEAAVHNQAAMDAAAERSAERRRARDAERAVIAWQRMTYAILMASIIVLVAAILVVHARADDAKNTPVFAMNHIQTEVQCEIAEDF